MTTIPALVVVILNPHGRGKSSKMSTLTKEKGSKSKTMVDGGLRPCMAQPRVGGWPVSSPAEDGPTSFLNWRPTREPIILGKTTAPAISPTRELVKKPPRGRLGMDFFGLETKYGALEEPGIIVILDFLFLTFVLPVIGSKYTKQCAANNAQINRNC